MKLLFIFLASMICVVNAFAQNTNSVDLTKTLMTQGAWMMDEFYIDSILSADAEINSLVIHFYANGDFSRGKNDILLNGMFWDLTGNDQLKITCPQMDYTENCTIVYLASGTLVTHQSVIGVQDGKPHVFEARYKPYIVPTQ